MFFYELRHGILWSKRIFQYMSCDININWLSNTYRLCLHTSDEKMKREKWKKKKYIFEKQSSEITISMRCEMFSCVSLSMNFRQFFRDESTTIRLLYAHDGNGRTNVFNGTENTAEKKIPFMNDRKNRNWVKESGIFHK